MSKNSFAVWLNRGWALFFFLLGKIVRYTFYFVFLFFLVKNTNGFAGFTGNQILFFTATYLLIDTLAQFLFRSVYSFRPLVVSGDLDLVLLKPINILFRSLLGGIDFIDLITIPPIIFVVSGAILIGLNYMIYKETREMEIQGDDGVFFTIFWSILLTSLTIWMAVFGPRSALFQ